MEIGKAILLLGAVIIIMLIRHWWFKARSKRRSEERRDYYVNEYLKSDEWKRKWYVVLKRDNWKCVYCGAPVTQVHHERYARVNIGKEPIE